MSAPRKALYTAAPRSAAHPDAAMAATTNFQTSGTAVKRASENGYPMDKFIGVWWAGGEDDARPAGAQAKGYLTLNFAVLKAVAA